MGKNTHRTDQLLSLVNDAAEDMLRDSLPGVTWSGAIDVVELEADTDDGAVFGTYDILAGDTIRLRVKASAVYGWEKDCWSWSSESHYTKPVESEELEEFEWELAK